MLRICTSLSRKYLQRLSSLERNLRHGRTGKKRAEVWFCGPQGLADMLRKGLQSGLQSAWPGGLRFHHEAFEMR